jgi:predicted ester cyclase
MYSRVRGRPLVAATIVVAALGALLLDPGMISHFPGAAEPNDLATQSGMGGAFWRAFPDLAHTIDFMVAEGDRVSTRLTLKGTHTGEFMGVLATGNSLTLTANGISRIVDGKITEQWVEFDSMSLMMEIGAGPS